MHSFTLIFGTVPTIYLEEGYWRTPTAVLGRVGEWPPRIPDAEEYVSGAELHSFVFTENDLPEIYKAESAGLARPKFEYPADFICDEFSVLSPAGCNAFHNAIADGSAKLKIAPKALTQRGE